jgi:hypothetical protein
MLGSLILGAIIGGAVVWYWKDEMRQRLNEKTHNLRLRAVEGLEAAEKKAEVLIDRAKPQITAKIRAGREAIRPVDTPRVDRSG